MSEVNESDESLIARYRAGESACFDEVVRRYTPRIYNFVFRLSGDPENAEDLTQETFVKAWHKLGSYQSHARFSPWLFTIARNVTTDYLRKKKSIPFSSAYPDDAEANIADTEVRTAEEELARKGDATRVTKALIQLPMAQREVLLLRYEEGLTYEESAAVLGVSLNTAKSRGRRALISLRTILDTMHQKP